MPCRGPRAARRRGVPHDLPSARRDGAHRPAALRCLPGLGLGVRGGLHRRVASRLGAPCRCRPYAGRVPAAPAVVVRGAVRVRDALGGLPDRAVFTRGVAPPVVAERRRSARNPIQGLDLARPRGEPGEHRADRFVRGHLLAGLPALPGPGAEPVRAHRGRDGLRRLRALRTRGEVLGRRYHLVVREDGISRSRDGDVRQPELLRDVRRPWPAVHDGGAPGGPEARGRRRSRPPGAAAAPARRGAAPERDPSRGLVRAGRRPPAHRVPSGHRGERARTAGLLLDPRHAARGLGPPP